MTAEWLLKWLPWACKVIRWLTGRRVDRGTVLIVEDDANDALWLERLLHKLHYDCEIARSAEVAEGTLRRTYYHIIFVDLRLPGMSGQAFLRVLSEQAPNSRIIVVSGEPSDLSTIPEGKPVIYIRKGATHQGLMELFRMIK